MNLALYQIEDEYIQLTNQLIDGELTPEIESLLVINKENLQNKAVNYGFVVKQLNSECQIIENEIERLTALANRREKVISKLKATLSEAMQLYEIDKIETPIMKISFRKSESIEIDNMALIDQKFMVEKTTTSPDKKAIKEAIVSGDIVTGARLQVNKNIQIK